MNWSIMEKRKDGAVSHASGPLSGDQYTGLRVSDGPEARVNVTLSESYGYGEIKISASVTLACDQNEKTINTAGRLATEKAMELLKKGFARYGMIAGPAEEE